MAAISGGGKAQEEQVLARFVRGLEEKKRQVEKVVQEIEQNIEGIKREEEQFSKVIKMAADQGELKPWELEKKLEIIQFIREKREELDSAKREMSRI